MGHTAQSRKDGWLGKLRNYTCLECGCRFQVDTLRPVPEEGRYCGECCKNPDIENRRLVSYDKGDEMERLNAKT